MKAFLTATMLAIAPISCAFAADPQPQTSATSSAPQILEGKRFTMLVEGEGPDVILIPGLSTPRAVWNATAEKLKSKYRLHILQIRGFGDDAGLNADGEVLAPLVTELTDYIDDEIIDKGRPAPAIIGHSLGGLTGLMVAADAPDKVGKLMVVDALPFIGTLFGQASADSIRPQAEAIAAQLRATYGTAQPTDEPSGNEPQTMTMSISQEGRKQVSLWSRKSDMRVVAQAMHDDMVTDMRSKLPQITAPVTLLYAHDANVMSGEAVTAAFVPQYEGTAHFTPVMVDGSRHFIMLDQPERFETEVEAFLK